MTAQRPRAGDRIEGVEDARAEAQRIVTEHPGYEYRKERGGDVCIGCGAKIYSLDGYGRHVAEKALAAPCAVPSDHTTTTEDAARVACTLRPGRPYRTAHRGQHRRRHPEVEQQAMTTRTQTPTRLEEDQ